MRPGNIMAAALAAAAGAMVAGTGTPAAAPDRVEARGTGAPIQAAANAFDRLTRAGVDTARAMHLLGLTLRRAGRRLYPRKTPDWTNARYRRAAAKKRAVKRNRKAHR